MSAIRPGGGEVTRYVTQHARGRVAKAAIISAIPPVVVKTGSNPSGTPIEAFDGYRAGLAANRAQLYLVLPAHFTGSTTRRASFTRCYQRSFSIRPICTLRRAGVSGDVRERCSAYGSDVDLRILRIANGLEAGQQ
jgi:hypothetical protein